MSGRNPPSYYCTLTLIAMQGHQQKGRQTNTSSNNKDKSNTIIETSTAEDHDDENLHNPSTRPRYSPGSRRKAVGDHTMLLTFGIYDNYRNRTFRVRPPTVRCLVSTFLFFLLYLSESELAKVPRVRPLADV